MAGSRLSRRKIAAYYADELQAGNNDVTKRLVAFLVENRRVRELDLIVRDIEEALAERGVLLADIASSRKLSAEAAKAVEAYLKKTTDVKTVKLRETVDPTLLGGVRVALPGRELDATLRHRISQLKASKI